MLVEKIEVFLQILEKSGLLSPSQLAEARRYSELEPADPISIAKQLIRAGLLNKWQANHLLRGRWALSLGPYPFLDQIDAGRDQRLYLSKDPNSGELIELKILSRRQSSGDPAVVQKFQEQSFRLAELDHPALAKVRGGECVDDRYVLVAEHLSGRTLAEVLAEGKPLPIETAVNHLLRAAEALAYAHKNGCAHGDLRPANLILDQQGDLRVARLGFTSLTPLAGNESGGEGLGIEAGCWHRAPEGRVGDGESTAGGDLYSLGAILFALVTGDPPEGPQTAKEVREARPDVPRELSELLARLLAATPSDRETSADAVVESLQTWRAGQAAARPGRVKSRPPKRSPDKVAIASASETPRGVTVPPVASPSPPGPAPEVVTDAADGEPEIEVLPADGPIGDLGLQTKARRRPRAPGGRPREKAATTRLLSPAFLAGTVGGGIALIGLIVLVFVLFRRGSTVENPADAEVAIAETVEPSEPEPEPVDPLAEREIDPDPLETDPVLPRGSELDRAPDPSIAMVAPPTDPEQEPETVPEPTTVAGDEASADSTAAEVDEERPAEAADPEHPADAGEGPLPPVEEQPVEEQPAEEPEEDLPPPFSDLPSIVSLPSLDAADAMQPVTLGNIYAGRDELCFIRLRGGASAARGGHAFSMRNAQGGLAEREWEISFRPSGGQDRLIAQLAWNDQSELVFQWQPAAAEEPLAAHLINCALSFTCRGETQVSVLREAGRHAPLEIDWEQATTRQEWELPFPPNPDDLWIEVIQLEGAQHSIDPQPPIIRASRGEAWVRIADAGGVLMLKIEPDLRRGFFVTVSPHVQFRRDAPPERLNMRQLNMARQSLQAGIQQLTMRVRQTKAVRSKLPEPHRKDAEQTMRTLENELSMANEHRKQFEEFEKMLKQVQPRLHLRLFYRADGSEVSLLRIGE